MKVCVCGYLNMKHCVYSIQSQFSDAPRHKRGRHSDPGPRGAEASAEQRLESLITRVGEKVTIGRSFVLSLPNPEQKLFGLV